VTVNEQTQGLLVAKKLDNFWLVAIVSGVVVNIEIWKKIYFKVHLMIEKSIVSHLCVVGDLLIELEFALAV